MAAWRIFIHSVQMIFNNLPQVVRIVLVPMGIGIAAIALFAVLGVSIFGHGSFYVLITKYDVSLLSPLTLMVPVWGVIFGVMLLGEPFTVQFLIGGVVSLAGVLIIALRPNTKLPFAVLAKKMVGSS